MACQNDGHVGRPVAGIAQVRAVMRLVDARTAGHAVVCQIPGRTAPELSGAGRPLAWPPARARRHGSRPHRHAAVPTTDADDMAKRRLGDASVRAGGEGLAGQEMMPGEAAWGWVRQSPDLSLTGLLIFVRWSSAEQMIQAYGMDPRAARMMTWAAVSGSLLPGGPPWVRAGRTGHWAFTIEVVTQLRLEENVVREALARNCMPRAASGNVGPFEVGLAHVPGEAHRSKLHEPDTRNPGTIGVVSAALVTRRPRRCPAGRDRPGRRIPECPGPARVARAGLERRPARHVRQAASR